MRKYNAKEVEMWF